MGTLCRSQEFSFCAALFLLLLLPANISLFVLLGFFTLSPQLCLLNSTLDFPASHRSLGTLSRLWSEAAVGLSLLVLHLLGIAVHHCLMSSYWNYCMFCLVFFFLNTVCLCSFFFFFNYYLFIYLFLAVLGLRFCARTFSSCGKRGPLFIVVRGPLTIVASLVVEYRLQTRRLSSCGSRA